MRAERMPDHGVAMSAGGSTRAPAVDVEEAVRRCVEGYGRLVGDRIVAFVPSRLRVRADPDTLDTVLSALVSNAIKFAPPRSPVHISATSDVSHVVVSVRDSGAGVPPEDRARLVHSSDGPVARPRTLDLVRELVERHGGQLWVERAPEGGAAFCFTLPRAERRSGPRAVPS